MLQEWGVVTGWVMTGVDVKGDFQSPAMVSWRWWPL